MSADVAVFLVLALFQLAGAGALFPRALNGRREPVLILVALLVMNAALSFFAALERAGSSLGPASRLAIAVDAPSGALILAFVLSWRGHTRAARGLLGAGVVLAFVVGFASQAIVTAINWPLVALPYYASLAILVTQLARGHETERWIALAFLPRAMLFLGQVLVGSVRTGVDPALWLAPPFSGVTVVAMSVAVLWGAWRLARHARPTAALVVACVILGPADALAWSLVADAGGSAAAMTFLNHLTLTVVRPVILYVGLAPMALRAIMGRTAFAGGCAAAMIAAGAWLGLPGPASVIVALSMGAFALAMLSADVLPRRARHIPVLAATPARGEQPQWTVLMRALAGSGTGDVLPRWTQKQLALRTGIDVKRVSAFPKEMNENAMHRLAAYGMVPVHAGGGAPLLVTSHKGAVGGLPGVWVYYRLTPLGEKLAQAIGGSSTPADPPTTGV